MVVGDKEKADDHERLSVLTERSDENCDHQKAIIEAEKPKENVARSKRN